MLNDKCKIANDSCKIMNDKLEFPFRFALCPELHAFIFLPLPFYLTKFIHPLLSLLSCLGVVPIKFVNFHFNRDEAGPLTND